MTPPPDDGTTLRQSFAARVTRTDDRWQCELLAADADEELPALERALGEPGTDGRPGPFVIVVDSRLYFVVLRYGIAVEGGSTVEDAFDDEEQGWPGGDLDVFSDAGLPAEELTRLLDSDELWADEMVLSIARRLGFADELVAVAAA
jgi:hypothetical protein